jgi:ATP-dependent Clp protease, protease subunit
MNEKMTEFTKILEKACKASIPNEWESSVPVVSDGNRHFVYICSDIAEPSNYNKLCHMLYNAKEYDEFILNINSPGGIIDSALMIIDAIKTTPAKVYARLTGTVASAATLISMACDEIYPTQGLSFMIHNYSSGGMQGKGHEMKARQQFIDRQLNRAFRDYYIGFLTDEEMSEIIEGKDIWLDHEEVAERWALKKSFVH